MEINFRVSWFIFSLIDTFTGHHVVSYYLCSLVNILMIYLLSNEVEMWNVICSIYLIDVIQ